MNKAKEEALKMLKNNNAAKAAEILKKKSIETNAPSKNKSNFLEALDIRPLFSADAEKEEAHPVAKLVVSILSLICGALLAYLISGVVEGKVAKSEFLLISFVAFFVVGLGFAFTAPTEGSSQLSRRSSDDLFAGPSHLSRRSSDDHIYSPTYSFMLGNIYHRR